MVATVGCAPVALPDEPAGGARLAELCGTLSLASDLAVGVDFEAGIRSTLLAVGLADALGLDAPARADVFYLNLLRMSGCTASPEMADFVGDLQALGALFDQAGADFGDRRRAMPLMLRHVTAGESPLGKVRNLARMMTMRPSMMEGVHRAHCEVAEHLATSMGATAAVRDALGFTYERYDGSGTPNGVKGDGIPLIVRIVSVAYHAEAQHRLGGAGLAAQVARDRAGTALDPEIAEAFAARADDLVAVLDGPSPWTALLEAEPGPPRTTDDAGVDAAAAVLGDFAEPLPWMKGHGRRVADLAGRAAAHAGLAAGEVADVRRAGHVHDVGHLADSLIGLDRAGALTDVEWDAVRLHAHHTERIVSRATPLRRAARIAGHHHERADAGGYHRQLVSAVLPLESSIVAVADVFDALRSDRPHRSARSDAEAADIVETMAKNGALDRAAVDAVLAAAEQRTSPPVSRPRPAALTDRETEVLAAVARGLSIKQAAILLELSPKTVDAHLQKIYPKLGVSTRAAATLCAVELGLVNGRRTLEPV
jgi:HD-GYP domain-containing protein (c-di-GMP phosphodiesterase class II)